ncbi:hypothetical protein SAMN02745248_01176 [Hathewaya proteolytica DSM 3090]|uniref:Uncharacterized protein n=1 Tax=Hathewaya proteolytica DSM 3090 TaxID=1121331 RepID=A0A1M6MUE5_9CLOT|nr:hypothetical protein [Hathewaya proteolytica]SHJ87091.1 hypothetical protein SAMN02745248_01176 [Hathewaya proteolytica DSM 3090]
MNIKGREIKVNKNILIIVGVIVFITIGFIGKGNNEEKRMIENTVKAIEARDYDYAEEALASVVDGNNKKVDKLWNIIKCYKGAQTEFYAGNINKANEYLEDMNNEYKKYDTLKEDVEKLKADVKEREAFIEEIRGKIPEYEKVLKNKEYEKYNEIQGEIKEIGNKDFYFKLPQDILTKLNKLELSLGEGIGEYNSIKAEKQKQDEEKESKAIAEKFTPEMAKEYAEKDTNINTGNTRLEIISTPEYDEAGIKYYKVAVYLKDSNELMYYYAVYATGGTQFLSYN